MKKLRLNLEWLVILLGVLCCCYLLTLFYLSINIPSDSEANISALAQELRVTKENGQVLVVVKDFKKDFITNQVTATVSEVRGIYNGSGKSRFDLVDYTVTLDSDTAIRIPMLLNESPKKSIYTNTYYILERYEAISYADNNSSVSTEYRARVIDVRQEGESLLSHN